MAKISLPNAGDFHMMVVRDCKVVRGKFGDEVMFSDIADDCIYMSKATADRQLARIFGDGWAYADAIGNALHFSRSPNTKTPGAAPFWNIRPAEPGEAHAKTSVRLAAPPADQPPTSDAASGSTRRREVADAYVKLFKFVEAQLKAEASTVQAATATIWLSWGKLGIQPDGKTTSKPTPADAPAVEPPPVVKHPAPSGKRLTAPEEFDYSKVPPPSDDDLPF